MNRVQVSKADSLLVGDKDRKIRELEQKIKQLEAKEKTGTVESGNTKHTAKWESVGAKKMYLAMTKLPITKQNMEFLDTNYQFQLLLKGLQQMKRQNIKIMGKEEKRMKRIITEDMYLMGKKYYEENIKGSAE